MDLDSIDTAILEHLQQDGRVTNAELADRVGLSPSACLRRVRNLEESGIISGYAAVINRAAIGRSTSVFVQITLEGQESATLDAFEEAVVDHPAVMSCHLMAGQSDYLVHVVCHDVGDYEQFHRTHLAQLPAVARIQSNFALRSVIDRITHELT